LRRSLYDSPVLVLHVLQGPDRGKHFELPQNEPQMIGRSAESLPLTDTTVSRRHAELTPDNGKWFLRDLESANGTFVNGELIHGRVELAPGDQVRCGDTLLLFNISPERDRSDVISLLDDERFETTIEGEERVPVVPGMPIAQGEPGRSSDSQSAAHLKLIYELTDLPARCANPQELLDRVMDLVFRELNPERGFILLQRGPTDRATPAVVRYATRPKTRDDGRIPVSRTIVEHTLTHRQGVLSTNAMNDSRFRSGDSVQEYGIRSAICVPIVHGERVYGVIHVDNSLSHATFTEAQLKLMTAIGQHAGLALTTAELIHERLRTERLAAVGETVASLSHSIKNILQGLRGGTDAVELALSRKNMDMAHEAWPIVSRNIDRIFALTLNMLAYSKPRSLDIELRDVRPLIDEVARLLESNFERKRVGMLVDVAEDMPPVPMDEGVLHQVLTNLLSNALDAAPEKKGVVTIRAAFDAEHQQAIIDVSDNGEGIADDRLEHIFEPFSSTKGARGTGLGLAVSRKLVEEHGGRLNVRSSPGAGTTFSIVLPTDRDDSDAADTRQPQPLPERGLDDDVF
jgi:two-component system NtrC family sensor kinase